MNEMEKFKLLVELQEQTAQLRIDFENLIQGIIDEVVESQADLQTALGVLRLNARGRDLGVFRDDYEHIEDKLAKSLARQHDLLRSLGKEMANAATHPEILPWTP